ncbi:hypothetical protein ACJMK2_034877 [Sinanodonta woodiana]|uniref:Uncharacterized protein n=1 Tax=Sinanodonta woodiana TaxID=1069815 RepID=A0ABD3WT56_SINWO
MDEHKAVAVIGIGCRFPGANDKDEYWRLLLNSENHIVEVKSHRSGFDNHFITDPLDAEVKQPYRAGLVERFSCWDNKVFGITEQEAEWIDPQQRFVLDCTHMAMEDAGLTRRDLDGTNTGVYIGVMNDDFKCAVLRNLDSSSSYLVTGINSSIISARVSYVYNLHGPSMTIDTACSSSLVAIHQGALALAAGDCDMAICGGVSLLLDPNLFKTLSNARMLSPTGQCHSFTSKADGYTRGEGCGMVILKRVEDAVKCDNKIWGFLGTGVNQDGHMATPITAPSEQQQIALLHQVYKKYHVSKSTIQVIEAHGTGTALGDPTECNALGTFFKEENSSSLKHIGSVKSNIGHLESAAGVAGLIKVLLMMHHEKIVPSLHVDKEGVNPKNNLEQHGLVIPTKNSIWPSSHGVPRMACVNSFGFGGTNAHAIVQQYIKIPEQERNPQSFIEDQAIIVLSGTTQEALTENVCKLVESLNKNSYNLHDLSYTSTCKRDHFPFRIGFTASTQSELITKCQNYLNGRQDSKRKSKVKIVFVFCGVGTVWQGMCSNLVSINAFREKLMEVDRLLAIHTGWSVAEKMKSDEVMADPMVGHISIFACQVSLLEMWKSCGIQPDAVVGQSVGEVAAAYASGAISLGTAVEVIYWRSKLLSEMTGGKMMVVSGLELSKLQIMCKSQFPSVCVAVHNSPVSGTLSGDAMGIEAIKQEILRLNNEGQHILLKELNVSCAYHSHCVESAKIGIVQSLSNINGKHPQIPIVSTVTGTYAESNDFTTACYWGENVREEVRFLEAIQTVAAETSTTVFLEIGPHPVLAPHVNDILPSSHTMTLPSMKVGKEIIVWKETLVELYQLGLGINWETIIPNTKSITEIPKYRYFGKNLITHIASAVASSDKRDESHMYVRQERGVNDHHAHYKVTINEEETPFIFDHYVQGKVIVPGAFYADVGLQIGKDLLQKPIHELQVELEFLKTLPVNSAASTEIDIPVELNENVRGKLFCEFEVVSQGYVRAKGRVKSSSNRRPKPCDIEQAQRLFTSHLTKKEAYRRLENFGFRYGEAFSIIDDCALASGECLAKFKIPSKVMHTLTKTHVHPAILDGMLQTCALAAKENNMHDNANSFPQGYPVGIDSIRVFKSPMSQVLYCYLRLTDYYMTDKVIDNHADAFLMDEDGDILVELKNITIFGRRPDVLIPKELKYVTTAQSYRIQSTPLTKTVFHKVMLVHGDSFRTDYACFDPSSTIIVAPKSLDGTFRDTIQHTIISERGSSDLVSSVLFLPGSIDIVERTIDGLNVMNTLKWNCLVFAELIRVLNDMQKQMPVFVITENTQGLDESDEIPINICGSELWGLVRSVLKEYVYMNIFLIDVVSMQQNESLLKDILAIPSENLKTFPKEIILSKGKIYALQLHNAAPTERIPVTRAVPQRAGEETLLRVEKHDRIIDPYLIPCIGQDELKSGWIKVEVQSASINGSLAHIGSSQESMFDCSGRKCDANNIDSTEVVGFVEYTEMYKTSLKQTIYRGCEVKYSPQQSTSNDTIKVVMCYPIQVGTFIRGPRACVVPIDEIPNYFPGKLSNLIRSWYLIRHVPRKKKIGIFCNHRAEDCPMFDMIDDFNNMGYNVDVCHLTPIKEKCKINHTLNTIILLHPLQPGQEECFLEHLSCSKRLLSMANHISRSLQERILQKNTISCKFIEEYEIFNAKTLPIIVPKVVSSMKRDGITLFTQLIEDANHNPLLNVIDIMPIHGNCSLKRKVTASQLFDKVSTYIVVGGLTGLGWVILKQLAEMGAGVIVTFSRRGPMQEKIQEIRDVETAHGCKIICLKVDVADLNSLKLALGEIRGRFPAQPVRGIFQGAGTIDSGLFLELTPDKFDTVMLPKVAGSWNLHCVSLFLPLDFFVLHSSISGILGSPGDSNYGAANTFLDALSHYRRQKGLPCQSINWGGLHVGLAASPQFATIFEARGFLRLDEEQIRHCFLHALMQDLPQVVYSSLDWDLIAKDYTKPGMDMNVFKVSNILNIKGLKSSEQKLGLSSFSSIDWQTFRAENSSSQLQTVIHILMEITGVVTNVDISELQPSTLLGNIGIDSLSAIHYINIISDVFKCKLPVHTVLSPDSSIKGVAELLTEKIDVAELLSSKSNLICEVDAKGDTNGFVHLISDVPPEINTASTKL